MASVGELVASIKVNGVSQVEKQLDGVSKKMQGISGKMDKAGSNLAKAGSKMTVATTPLSLGLIKSGQEAVKFQDDFAGVRKTVDGSEKYFTNLRDEMINMSKEAPTSVNELARIGETAGQLGIEKDAIAGFSRTIADISTATNLTSEQASMDMAVLASITDMPQTKFSNLGSAIVELGNNLPTTEADIVSMGQRMASTADQVGLTEREILGISATMSSLGIRSEEGGSAMRSILSKINTAVADSGAELDLFAEQAGMSSKEFSSLWKEKPMEAMQVLSEGLGQAGAEGKDMDAILKDLGISGLRESNVMTLLAGNSERLSDSVKMSNDAFKENSALSDEVKQKYDTVASKFKIFKNNITALAIEVGDILMPYIEKLIDKATQLVQWFSNLSDGSKKMAIGIGLVVSVLPPLLTGLGLLFKGMASGIIAIGKVISFIKKFGMAISGVVKFVIGFGSTVKNIAMLIVTNFGFILSKVKGVLLRLAGLFMSNPWMLLVTALITVGVLIYKHWDKIVAFTKNIWNGLKQWFAPYWNSFVQLVAQAVTWIVQKWQGFKAKFISIITSAVALAKTVWNTLSNVVAQVVSWIVNKWVSFKTMFISIVQSAINIGLNIWNTLKSGISAIWNGIVTVVRTTFNIIKNIILVAVGVILTIIAPIYNTFATIWNKVVEVVGQAINFIKQKVQTLVIKVKAVLQRVKAVFTAIWNSIYSNIIAPIIDKVIALLQNMKARASAVLSRVKAVFSSAWNRIKSIVSSVINAVINFIVRMYNRASSIASQIYSVFTNYWQQIRGVISNIINAIINFIVNLYNRASSIASQIYSTFTDYWQQISSVVSGVIDTIIGYVQDLYNRATGIASDIYNSFSSTWRDISSAVSGAVDDMIGKIQGLWDSASGIASDIKNAFSNIFTSIKIPTFSMGGWTPADLPSLPKMSVNWNASGGILDSATFIGAGEKGTESIVPLSSQRKMKPFAQAVSRFMPESSKTSAEGSGADSSPTVVSVQVDSREIARATAEPIDNELRNRADSRKRSRGGY